MEFANVVLQTKDSIFIAGGVTDSKGRFMMENIQTGSYLLCISGMGYTSRIISLDHLAVSKDLGVIMISPESILLKEVAARWKSSSSWNWITSDISCVTRSIRVMPRGTVGV